MLTIHDNNLEHMSDQVLGARESVMRSSGISLRMLDYTVFGHQSKGYISFPEVTLSGYLDVSFEEIRENTNSPRKQVFMFVCSF